MAPRFAVLIADVVNSTAFGSRLRPLLSKKLGTVSRVHQAEGLIRLSYQVTAGDEIQTLASGLLAIPRLIFDLRRLFHPLELRIGVGIGKIPGRIVAPVNRMTGEAFVLARLALENLGERGVQRSGSLTRFRSPEARFDRIANALYGLHDTLVGKVTEKQWQTLNLYLRTRREDKTARQLGVNVSTVSRNLQRGHLRQMEETAEALADLLDSFFPAMHG